MLFYTFDLVISAEKTNEHEQKKVYNHIYFFLFSYENIFFQQRSEETKSKNIGEGNKKCFFFLSFVFCTHETAAVRAEMLL